MKQELTEKETGYLIGLLAGSANKTESPDMHQRIFNKLNKDKL